MPLRGGDLSRVAELTKLSLNLVALLRRAAVLSCQAACWTRILVLLVPGISYRLFQEQKSAAARASFFAWIASEQSGA